MTSQSQFGGPIDSPNGSAGQRLYRFWLDARCFVVGLKIAWVSAASAAIGFLLFLTALPAQDILLEAKGDLHADLVFWGSFYLLVILAWALPVFVSARWILGHFENPSQHFMAWEPLPPKVRKLIPAVLAVLCFLAVLAGQFMALRNAPAIIDENTKVALQDARSVVDKDAKKKAGGWAEACRGTGDKAYCKQLLQSLAVVVGAEIAKTDRSNAPYLLYGLACLVIVWLFVGRRSAFRSVLSANLSQRITTFLMLGIFAALAAAYYMAGGLIQKFAGIAQIYIIAPAAVIAPIVIILAWKGYRRALWWVVTACAVPGAAFIAFALYGVIEAERTSDFNVVHLLLLPMVTIAAAALCWWWLKPRAGRSATLIGQFLLKTTDGKDAPSETVATAKLVKPIFYVLLTLTVAATVAAIAVHPLRVTEWVHRALLLPIILGMPVAALTYLTYWSKRVGAPLVLLGLILVSGLGVFSAMFSGDYYRVRTTFALKDAPVRPGLADAVKQWAAANACDLPGGSSPPINACPPPIIVAAAGGASRAAFHTAGVIGSLIDGGKLSPIKGHTQIVYSAAFSPDGKRIVTASFDGTARLWDAATGQQVGVLEGHEGRVLSAAFSDDGQRVVTGSTDKTAAVWDVANPRGVKRLRQLKDHAGSVIKAAFAPGGKLVVTASNDHTARIWEAETGKSVAVLKGHTAPVYGAVFSPDGRTVVTGALDRTARMWDVSNLSDVRQIRMLTGHADDVNSTAYSSDGRLILTASDDKTARIWDAQTGEEKAVLKGQHTKLIYNAVFSPDGTRVVTGAWDKTAVVWDVSDLQAVKAIHRLQGHKGDVNSVAFNADGSLIVTASDDKTARIWDAATGKRKEWPAEAYRTAFSNQLFAISGVSGGALGAVFTYAALADSQRPGRAKNRIGNPPCTRMAVQDADWFASKVSRSKLPAPAGAFEAGASEPSEDPEKSWKACLQSLLAGDFLSPVFVGMVSSDPLGIALRGDRAELIEQAWEVRYARLTGQDPGLGVFFKDVAGEEPNAATTLAQPLALVRSTVKGWLPILLLNGTSAEDGRRIVTSDIDMSQRDSKGKVTGHALRDAFDFHDLFSAPKFHGHTKQVMGVAVSPDGARIVTTSVDKTARIWDAKTGAQLAVLVGHRGRVLSAAFSPVASQVVTGAWDHTARIWDISNLAAVKEIRVLSGHTGDVNSAAFSPDGKLIVTASDDRTARLWDAATGMALAVITGHERQVYSAAFSPDGTRVVTASWDNTARIWDVTNPGAIKGIAVLKGHRNDVNVAAFDPTGKLVITGSDDKSARIWDAQMGAELARLPGHEGGVYGAAFSPDGRSVVTAAWDHTARIWDVSNLQDIKRTAFFDGHRGDVNSAAFSPDGTFVVTGSDDRTARIWDMKGDQKMVLEEYETAIPCTGCDVRLSTAVMMSARFPFISPPGSILDQQRATIARVVDGGYHENFGATTAMELAKTLKKEHGLDAAVILINNDPRVSKMECIADDGRAVNARPSASSWFPTFSSPLDAIIATRTARGSHAAVNLCMELKDEKLQGTDMKSDQRFAFITVGTDRVDPKKDLSVSWWMSKRVQKHLDDQLAENSLNIVAYRKIAKMRR